MFAIGNNELASCPDAGATLTCPHCGAEHEITYSDTGTLGTYDCGGVLYLGVLNGKVITHQFKKGA